MGRSSDKAPAERWQVAEIASAQNVIRAQLAAIEGVDGKVQAILEGIEAYGKDHTPDGQLRRYVYCMSGLVHHQRYGGLKRRQLARMSDLAFAILKAQGISTASSRLSFLYGDLHLILSQIYRTSGRIWEAAWEYQLGRRLSKQAAGRGQGFQAMAAAVRALRLAQGRVAEAEYRAAETLAQTDEARINAALGRLKTMRIVGKVDETLAEAARLELDPALVKEQRLELAWEVLCTKAQRGGDLDAIVRAVRRGGTHHASDYQLEAHYWARSMSSTRWTDALPSVRTMARSRTLKPQKHGLFFRLALAIEDAYDPDSPFELRLQRLGDLLAKASELISVDKEMLAWAAASRWLARTHSFPLAQLTMGEYHGIGLKLTDGRSPDPLGLLRDLANKSWHMTPAADPE